MKDDDKKKISDILDAFDAQRKVADQTAREMQARRDIFLEAFSHKTSSVIAPALNEVADYLKSRNHGCEVTREVYAINKQTGAQERCPSITLNIFPHGIQRPSSTHEQMHPSVRFVMDQHDQNKVEIVESNRMPAGGLCGGSDSGKQYSVHEITTEVVYSHVIKVLREAMDHASA